MGIQARSRPRRSLIECQPLQSGVVANRNRLQSDRHALDKTLGRRLADRPGSWSTKLRRRRASIRGRMLATLADFLQSLGDLLNEERSFLLTLILAIDKRNASIDDLQQAGSHALRIQVGLSSGNRPVPAQ